MNIQLLHNPFDFMTDQSKIYSCPTKQACLHGGS